MRTGTIKSLKSDSGNEEKCHGYVNERGSTNGLFFMANAIQGVAFTELKVGDEVEFQVNVDNGNHITNLVRACNKQGGQIVLSINTSASGANEGILALQSKIASLTSEADNKGYGFIRPIGKGLNYHFTSSELVGSAFADLKIDDEVIFELEKNCNGKVLTLRLVKHENRLVTTLPVAVPQTSIAKRPLPSIKKAQIVNNLIDILNVIPEMSESDEFEDAVFLLLKMLGISDVFQYDRKDQAGKADGFFLFKNLAVLYDCTLRSDFFDFKEEQIDNYVSRLRKSPLTMSVRKSDGEVLKKKFQLDQKNCHVWIITAGKKTREISDTESIRVKEVVVQDLIKLAKRRLHAGAFDGDVLLRQLENIEQV